MSNRTNRGRTVQHRDITISNSSKMGVGVGAHHSLRPSWSPVEEVVCLVKHLVIQAFCVSLIVRGREVHVEHTEVLAASLASKSGQPASQYFVVWRPDANDCIVSDELCSDSDA
eukprot:TRINITY_DN44331_c0_g1_i1.p2 TRINITY_DN44331_c0_g1~~TRINITY_DN44331_c0_g1_i1.p2  ORF type:complete len:114 (-),score=3.72 TRINITY_DN44331_c0_g1_i1:160-501(-)